MKPLSLLPLLLLLGGCVFADSEWTDAERLSATLDPFIYKAVGDACKDVPKSPREWGAGGTLIYKREKSVPVNGADCISHIKNEYYARCYRFHWDSKTDDEYIRPMKDVDLGLHSCIPEHLLLFTNFDQELKNAKLGETYKRHSTNVVSTGD